MLSISTLTAPAQANGHQDPKASYLAVYAHEYPKCGLL
jgi:hypothetical protein